MRYLNHLLLAFAILAVNAVSHADEGPVYGPEL